MLINDNDGDDDPLTARLVSPPQRGSLALGSDGSFRYTPFEEGLDEFTYVAADAASVSAPATVTVETRPDNEAPVARDDRYRWSASHEPRALWRAEVTSPARDSRVASLTPLRRN